MPANKTVTKDKKKPDFIIQNVDIRQIQRTNIDIDKWRRAIQTAESVMNPNRTALYNIYFDIILDAHLSSVIDKRKIAVIKCPITFTKDGTDVPEISNLAKQPWFQDMLSDLLDTRFWGFTLLEFAFNSDKTISYKMVPRKHVRPMAGHVLRNENDQTGIPFRDPPECNYLVEAGEFDDLGLLMKAAQYVIYKRNCFGDYAQYTELFGQPLRKGKYNPYDEASRLALKQSMEEMGSSPWVIYPEGTDIEFIEAKSPGGSNDLYKGLIEICNNEISKLIVGQTLTTESGSKGARSLGDVHMQVQQEIHFSDRLFIKNILNNQLKNLLILHGFNMDGGEFDFVDNESISLTDMIDIDTKLRDFLPLDDDYYYETYNKPKPDNYEALKAKMEEAKKTPAISQIPASEKKQPPVQPPVPKNKKWLGPFNFFHDAPQ